MDFAGKNSFENSSKTDTLLLHCLTPIFNYNVEHEGANFADPYSELNDFGRESLGIINLNDLDLGRESLGITNIKTTDFIGTSLPDIRITDLTQCSNNNGTDMFNNAFLYSIQNATNTSSVSSFNSASLNSSIPSRITSCSSYKSDVLNEVFIDSSDFIKQLQSHEKSTLPSMYLSLNWKNKNNPHQRIKSLPSTLETVMNSKKVQKAAENILVEPQEAFNDSVFIEANHLAARIEDGSILELASGENDMLELFQEPEDLKKVSLTEKSPQRTPTKPPELQVSVLNVSNSHVHSKVSLKQDESNCSINKTNISNKSKDPKQILNNLSEILNSDNTINEKQKSDCQNMISSLAEIFASSDSSKSNNLDDSGHSSIDNEPLTTSQNHECYEVLDLSRKSHLDTSFSQNESNENCGPLDLSIKSNKSTNSERAIPSPKILPNLFNSSQPKSILKDNKSLRNSNCSLSSNESKSQSEVATKFKLKKTQEKQNLKKGPLKAVVSVNIMTKKDGKPENSKLLKTPTRPEVNFKLKKTSTPVNDLLLKPVAQSTPETPHSVTPLSKPCSSKDNSSKNMKQKLDYSGSNLPVNVSQNSRTKPSFIRRRSVDDLKKNAKGNKLNRSYSAGESLTSTSNVKDVKRCQNTTGVLKENKTRILTNSSLYKKKIKENSVR